ncbi:nuclear transport factor 2 family protein [Sphingomonas solaris]|uniref:Nuclear transport factor 2 family protein n=1 Tax=Alterirhizorhabdus solaris TaxID=2529389 RepID=A0A558R0E1_9SPHN|nr:nuclear transport factor 2 family protein [Sphingomonas solaris]TVV72864.1 nuclear transport factor 2 family protein [Sphingomonas solaris]
MTDEEHRASSAIRATLAACTQAGDARRADVYAAAFTIDGVLDLGDRRLDGREAIREWMAAPSPIARPDAAVASPGFVSHHLTTCRIDVTGATAATVRTYWFVITAVGLDHSGYYADQFRCENGAWLIAHRRPRVLWVAPNSLIAGNATPG